MKPNKLYEFHEAARVVIEGAKPSQGLNPENVGASTDDFPALQQKLTEEVMPLLDGAHIDQVDNWHTLVVQSSTIGRFAIGAGINRQTGTVDELDIWAEPELPEGVDIGDVFETSELLTVANFSATDRNMHGSSSQEHKIAAILDAIETVQSIKSADPVPVIDK